MKNAKKNGLKCDKNEPDMTKTGKVMIFGNKIDVFSVIQRSRRFSGGSRLNQTKAIARGTPLLTHLGV